MKSAKNLEKIIREKGLNINQLAKKTNTTASTFYSAFDRDIEPSIDLIIKVAYALQMNPMELLKEMEADEKMLEMMAFFLKQDISQDVQLENLRKRIEKMISILNYNDCFKVSEFLKLFLQLSEKEQRLTLKLMQLFIDDWNDSKL